MLVRLLKDRLDPNQARPRPAPPGPARPPPPGPARPAHGAVVVGGAQTAALAQLSRAQPSILAELRGWVGEERVVAALCEVVDFLMKKAMFNMFG
jgi:hypothetical protein